MTNQRALFVLSRSKLLFLVLLNPAVAAVIYAGHQTWWAWTQTSLSDQKIYTVTDFIALLQFLLAAFTLDQTMRSFFVSFNRSLKQRVIPVFVIQLASLLVYGLFAIAAYLLLFDHSLTSLLAASGMISIGVGYFSKDLIQDVLMSVQIQADGLVSVNDWVHLHKMEEGEIYQVKEIDRRMTTLVGLNGYKQVIRNSVFYDMRLINLSRQEFGCSRRLEVDVDSQFPEEKILQILQLAIKHAEETNDYFFSKSTCRLQEVTPYRITYAIEYHCQPFVKPSESNHAVRQSALRFLRSAGVFEISPTVASLMSQLIADQRVSAANSGFGSTDPVIARLIGAVQYSFLKVLNQQELVQLSKNIRFVSLRSGECLIKEGDAGQAMYLISEGVLSVSVNNAASNQRSVAKLWPGDSVGEMSVLTGDPRTADVYVLEDVALIEIDKKSLEPVLVENNTLAEAMAHVVLSRQNSLINLQKFDEETAPTPLSLKKRILAFFKLT
jgi:CRP-like cAMP-binding protein